MGRGSFKSGNVFAQNLQATTKVATLGGTGTDSISVTFPKKMTKVPVVVPSVLSDKAITQLRVTARTKVGCTLKAVSSSLTGACTFGVIAYDDSYK